MNNMITQNNIKQQEKVEKVKNFYQFGLSICQLKVFVYLLKQKEHYKYLYPSIYCIALKVKCHPRTVHRAIQRLKECKLLTWVTRKKKTSMYFIPDYLLEPETYKKLWGYIKSLQPTFQFDPFTGNPQVSFRSGSIRPDYQTGTLFNLLEAQDKRVLISIDEFQQISSYPEKNTDSWLRSIIQNLTNVVFIFSGSQQHLMNEIFANPSRPFFRSTSFLQLNKLPFQEYKNFIMNKFQEARRNIDEKTIDEILEWTHCHTFYVQMLCSRVFSTGAKKIDNSIWKEEALKILKEQESIFYNYRVLLTRHQWNLLRAIALEETGYEPTSKSFISKYNLGSPSTVIRSATSLLGKEFLLTGTDTSGNKYYSVYDVFLERWIQYNFGTMH